MKYTMLTYSNYPSSRKVIATVEKKTEKEAFEALREKWEEAGRPRVLVCDEDGDFTEDWGLMYFLYVGEETLWVDYSYDLDEMKMRADWSVTDPDCDGLAIWIDVYKDCGSWCTGEIVIRDGMRTLNGIEDDPESKYFAIDDDEPELY